MKTVLSFLFLVVGLVGLEGQAPRLVVPIGHTKDITSVAFSPDGKFIITGSLDNTAKLWNLSGKELLTFQGHHDGVNSVAFSPDGKAVATGSMDGTVKLWNLAGQTLRTFILMFPNDNTVPDDNKGSQYGRIYSVAFSPDGKQILAGNDHDAILWNIAGGDEIIFYGDTDDDRMADLISHAVAFSPDGKYVIVGNDLHTATMWDVSWKRLHNFTTEGHHIRSISFSPDGQQVLTGGSDNRAILWNAKGRPKRFFSGHSDEVISVSFSPNGKQVLTVSKDGTAKLWSIAGQEIRTFKMACHSVSSAAFSPTGKQILTGGCKGTAVLWDLDTHVTQTFRGYGNAHSFSYFTDDTASSYLMQLLNRAEKNLSNSTFFVDSSKLLRRPQHFMSLDSFISTNGWKLNQQNLLTFLPEKL